MALEMRGKCEGCGLELGPRRDAFTCSCECTLCRPCIEGVDRACPNCGGELVRRPRRSGEVDGHAGGGDG